MVPSRPPLRPVARRCGTGLALAAALLLAGCDRDPPNTDGQGMAPNVPAASGTDPGAGNAPVDAGRPAADSSPNPRTGNPVGVPSAGPTDSPMPQGGVPSAAPAASEAAARSGPASPTALSSADTAFMAEAHVSGLFEVALGAIGAERARHPQAKALAGRLVADHGVANDELRALSLQRGATLPTALPADRQAVLDRLKATPQAQFDEALVQGVMIPAHQEDIARFERAAQSTQDDALKQWIERTLPVLRGHLKAAQTLALPVQR
ncbi:DUF4142 domain-containing protein [Aquincola sp. MAHUQ-54]|uniref:DUF4142 domain-containing protein n=1 Tax=Aquincola agrisoli TaxID=3119538 RepID=A0AAW9QEV8_9BURK